MIVYDIDYIVENPEEHTLKFAILSCLQPVLLVVYKL